MNGFISSPMPRGYSFAMLESVDVWCACGKNYTATDQSGDDTGTWQQTCPNCGEVVELTFKFRVVTPGQAPQVKP